MREDGDVERGDAGGPVPFVVAPGEGLTIQGPAGGPLTFKARGEQTDAALTVFENVIAPGDGPPLHTHAGEDESWYVLAGELRFRLGDDVATAAGGSFVFVPRGTPHCFQNVGAQPARIIVMFTPSGMERFFDRFAALPAGPGSGRVYEHRRRGRHGRRRTADVRHASGIARGLYQPP